MFQRIFASLSLALALSTSAWADGISCRQLPDLFHLFLSQHVSVRTMTDELKARTVDQYVKMMDPSKTIFTQDDVQTLKKKLTSLFETMPAGNCQALDDAQRLITGRAGENEAFTRAFLNDKYKLEENVEFVVDPEKRAYSKNKEEREALLKKFLHFQISNLLATDMKLPEARAQLVHRYELITKRLRERKIEDLYNTFANAFAAAMDPHSDYFAKDKLEDFQIDMRLSLEGIGASLSSQDGYTVVEEIIPGGAADRAKVLKPKDKIIAVAQVDKPTKAALKAAAKGAGKSAVLTASQTAAEANKGAENGAQKPVSVIDMDLKEVVKLIRGPKSTWVRLTIMRQEGDKTTRQEVEIQRDKIALDKAKIVFEPLKQGNKTYKFGIIDFPSFYGDVESGKVSSYEDLKKLLAQARKAKADGIILNVSRNGGGLLEDAKRISGLFLKKGPIVATKDARQNVSFLTDEDDSIAWTGPLLVLTSRVSASASEILAGALRDYHRALIVGADHTFGKGTVQAVLPLPRDLGALKVTTQKFFLPSGDSTQWKGVAGNIVLPSTLNNDEIGEKALENSLQPDKITPFLGMDANFEKADKHWQPLSEDEIQNLSKKSAARVAKDAKFQEINKEIEEAKKHKGIIRLAEIRQKAKVDKDKRKAEERKTLSERIREADAPYVKESMQILADLIVLRQAKNSPLASANKMPPATRTVTE